MKSNAKSKIIILITLGIVFALSFIINRNLNIDAGNYDICSEFSDDNNLDYKNLKFSTVSGNFRKMP